MGKMSLRKGQTFEREIAKIFSEWSGVKLVRTPLSGAWEGCEVDIWPENPEVYWPLAIECKKAESWNMDQVMEGTGPVYDWLKQAEQQAKEWGERTGKWREPILVFSRNRRPVYIATSCHVQLRDPSINGTSIIWTSGVGWGRMYYLLQLERFLARNSYNTIASTLDVLHNPGVYANALQREESRDTL